MPSSPVRDVDFGTALAISLNNYYDLLKLQVGGLRADEFLQLKLVADSVDISPKKVEDRGYRWFSYYQMVLRSDLQIEPGPITGQILTGAERLTTEYGRFLRKLRSFAITKDLSAAEQILVADKEKEISYLQDDALELAILDREKWLRYATLMGLEPGSNTQYLQWSNLYGKIRIIQQKFNRIKIVDAEKRRILDRVYPDPEDRLIIEAEFEFDNPLQRLRYPVLPDYEYDDGSRFSATYLALLPIGSTGLFDDRHVFSWDKTLETIKTGTGGGFAAVFDRSTARSDSIVTDWGTSGGGSYAFVRVNASVSEHTAIQSEFRKGTSIELAAKSTYKANLIYPAWFRPDLFNHKHVKANIRQFEEFFHPKGSLRYYPTALILLRGFSIAFNSTQNWTYDYERKFSASAGGGFSAFGISFGGSSSYSSHQKTHEVDVSNTKLTIADGDETVRFIGYAVKQTTVYDTAIHDEFCKLHSTELLKSFGD